MHRTLSKSPQTLVIIIIFLTYNTILFLDAAPRNRRSISIGGSWTSKIYFDPEADIFTTPIYAISDRELQIALRSMIDHQERILQIHVYTNRLPGLPYSQTASLFHAFIVLETNSYWWSIEKNGEGITIQRSRRLSYVRDRYRRGERLAPIRLRESAFGRNRMEDLVDWLYMNDELNKPYRLLPKSYNCQGFAERLFDQFAL